MDPKIHRRAASSQPAGGLKLGGSARDDEAAGEPPLPACGPKPSEAGQWPGRGPPDSMPPEQAITRFAAPRFRVVPMSVFAVEYVYAAGSDATRDEHRPKHREFLSGLGANGDGLALVASGPYVDGSGALLLISSPTQAALAETLANDPFAIHGAIAVLRITEWSPVTGELAHHA